MIVGFGAEVGSSSHHAGAGLGLREQLRKAEYAAR